MLDPRDSARGTIQVTALLAGVMVGLLMFFMVTGLIANILADCFFIPTLVLTISFCAYFFVAPASWRGLARRVLLAIGATIAVFAVLGYTFSSIGIEAGGMPSAALGVQFLLVMICVGAFAGASSLRERRMTIRTAVDAPEVASRSTSPPVIDNPTSTSEAERDGTPRE